MVDLNLPTPGQSPNWAPQLNTEIEKINFDLEATGDEITNIWNWTDPLDPDSLRFDRFPTRTAETVSLNNRAYQISPVTTLSDGGYVAVWYNELRHPIVGRFDTPSRSWATTDLHNIFSNPMGSPAPPDGHNSLVVAQDGAGYFHVMGNMHASIFRYLISAEPGVIDRWRIMPAADWTANASYPWVRTLANGDLLCFYRAGGTNNSDWFLRRYSTSTQTWGEPRLILNGRNLSPASGPYPNLLYLEGNTLHLFYMWRHSTTEDSNTDFSYVRSDDLGVTWKRVDGAAQALPITEADVQPRIIAGVTNFMNQGGTTTYQGNPHAIVRKTLSGTATLQWIRWDGSTWQNSSIASANAGDLGAPGLVQTASGGVLALFRRGSRVRARRLAPELGEEFDLLPYDVGNTEAGWSPAFDNGLLPSGVLRFVVSSTIAGAYNAPTGPTGPGGWGGIATVRLTGDVIRGLEVDKVAPGSTLPDLPDPAPPLVTDIVPFPNRVSFISDSNPWVTVGGGNRWESSVPILPRSRFHGVRTTFHQQSRISHAAVKVITAGDGDSRVQVVITESDGRVIGRSEMASATTTGVKQVEFTARASVTPGVVYYVGVIVWGGTTGVGVMLTKEQDPLISGPTAATMLDNIITGRRETSDGYSDNTNLNSLALSPYAPIVALRPIAPVVS